MHGKWAEAGVPHKGWSCVSVEDLGAPDGVCEMCETRGVRYIHHMQHPDYPHVVAVGCICAEKMEENYEAPRRRERDLINAAEKRKRWLSRKWRRSAHGNPFLNTGGFNITVFPRKDGSWGGRIEDRASGRSILSRRAYATPDEAKLAAFDAMIFLRSNRGWGT
jgi:hypothetical protein